MRALLLCILVASPAFAFPEDLPTDPPPGSPYLPSMPPPPTVAPSALQHTVRVQCAGRVGAGILLEGGAVVVTHARLVAVGWPPEVTGFDGTETRARIAAIDIETDLAVLVLDAAIPTRDPVVGASIPPQGQALSIVGHGGSVPLTALPDSARDHAAWSQLPTAVASVPAQEAGAPPPEGFLVSSVGGEGDLGATVWDAEGQLVGLLGDALPRGAGRSWVIAAPAILHALQAPRDASRDRRAAHLMSFGGLDLTTRNQPFHAGVGLLLGLRIVVKDVLRWEPFLSLDLGARWPRGGSSPAPWALWTSLEGGLDFGPRVPLFREGRRSYLVPLAGLRGGLLTASWSELRFETVCDGPCQLQGVREEVRERDPHIGLDLGIDLETPPLRVGYRYYLDPRDPRGLAMHRIVVTLDGFPFPIAVGPGR